MLKHTRYEEGTNNEIIVAIRDDRFYATKMPDGGWAVRDWREEFHVTTGDRVATVELADSLIGEWFQVADNYAVPGRTYNASHEG